MFSFDGLTAPEAILDGLRRGQVTSFCLFGGQNFESLPQLRALTESLYAAAASGGHPPPLIGIDQEGGQLIAVTGGTTELPGNMALGAARSPDLSEQAGRLLARELLALGINLNFAPSVDVNISPSNPGIGIRSFGEDPQAVADLGAAMIRGMQNEGLLACAKHFPGQGDVSTDTHHKEAVYAHPRERMEAVELVPFRRAIAADVASILTTHVTFRAIDADGPATLSRKVVHGLLRDEMGYDGLILTDAMDMYAVNHLGAHASLKAALAAGVDLALLGHLPDQLTLAGDLRALENETAVERIQRVRDALPRELPPLDVIGSSDHQQIAQQIADQSITVVRDGGQMPLRPGSGQTIAVITPVPEDLTPADTSSAVEISLAQAIRKRHPFVDAIQLARHAPSAAMQAVLDQAKRAERCHRGHD